MKRIPMKYMTEELSEELRLSTRRDKLGNIYHYVDYNNNVTPNYVIFLISHLH